MDGSNLIGFGDENAERVRVLRQQRNNLAVQMLELEADLMLTRERLAAVSAELDALRKEHVA